MKKDILLDEDISLSNYAGFKKGVIINKGESIRFIYLNNVIYTVEVSYILKWYPNPHYFIRNGKLIKWDKKLSKANNIKPIKCRRISECMELRIYFNDGSIYDIAWDNVLMACEPRYEHFGGFTNESKKIIKEYWKNRKIS